MFMVTIKIILLVGAFFCFTFSAIGLTTKIKLTEFGLALLTLSFII